MAEMQKSLTLFLRFLPEDFTHFREDRLYLYAGLYAKRYWWLVIYSYLRKLFDDGIAVHLAGGVFAACRRGEYL